MKIYGIIFVVILSVLLIHPILLGYASEGMDHSSHVGEKIHNANVEGYQFAYHLVDLKEQKLRHLMVYIVGPKGEKIDNAKVGFLVEGPDGSKQKLMATGMKGAFGVNVDLNIKGVYKIKMKIITNGKKLFDEFVYEVK
jgi:hypothetical protein